MKEAELKRRLTAELKSLKNKKIWVVLVKPEDYHLAKNMFLNHLISRLNLKGVYVNLNIPYYAVSENLKKNNIDSSKLYFIDGISKKINKVLKINNAFFLKDHKMLTELSIVIETAINGKKFNFLFFDSVSSLLIYNNLNVVSNFLYNMVGKIRNLDMYAVLLCVRDDESKNLLDAVSKF